MTEHGLSLVDAEHLAKRPGYLSRVVVNTGVVVAVPSGALVIMALDILASIGGFGIFLSVIAAYYLLTLLLIAAPAALVVAAIPPRLPRTTQRLAAICTCVAAVTMAAAIAALIVGVEVTPALTGAGAVIGLVVGLFAWLPRGT